MLFIRSLRRQSTDQASQEHMEAPLARRREKEGEGETGTALFTHGREKLTDMFQLLVDTASYA